MLERIGYAIPGMRPRASDKNDLVQGVRRTLHSNARQVENGTDEFYRHCTLMQNIDSEEIPPFSIFPLIPDAGEDRNKKIFYGIYSVEKYKKENVCKYIHGYFGTNGKYRIPAGKVFYGSVIDTQVDRPIYLDKTPCSDSGQNCPDDNGPVDNDNCDAEIIYAGFKDRSWRAAKDGEGLVLNGVVTDLQLGSDIYFARAVEDQCCQFFRLLDDLEVCSCAPAYMCDECGNQIGECKIQQEVCLSVLSCVSDDNCVNKKIPECTVVLAHWFRNLRKWVVVNWQTPPCPDFEECTPEPENLVKTSGLDRVVCTGVEEILDGDDGPSEECNRTRCVVDFVSTEKTYYNDDCNEHFCLYDTQEKHVTWTMPEMVLTCPESTDVVTQVLTEEKTIDLGGHTSQTININSQSVTATVVLDTPQPQNVTMTGTITGNPITLGGETAKQVTVNGTLNCEASLTTLQTKTVTSTGTVEGQTATLGDNENQTVTLNGTVEGQTATLGDNENQTVTLNGTVEGQTAMLGDDENRTVSGLAGICSGAVELGGFQDAEISLNGSTATANVVLDTPQPQDVTLTGPITGASVTLGGLVGSTGAVTGTCEGSGELNMNEATSKRYDVDGSCKGSGELDMNEATSKRYNVDGSCEGLVTLSNSNQSVMLNVNVGGLVVHISQVASLIANVEVEIPVKRKRVITDIQLSDDGCTITGTPENIWVFDFANVNPNDTYMSSFSATGTATVPAGSAIGYVSGTATATGTVSIPDSASFSDGSITGKTEEIKIPHKGSFRGSITGKTEEIKIPHKGSFHGQIEGTATVPVPTSGTLNGGSIRATGTVNVPTSGSVTGLTINGNGTVRVPTTATFNGGPVDFTSTGAVSVPTSATIEPKTVTSTGAVSVPTSATIESKTVTSTGTVSVPTSATIEAKTVMSTGTISVPTKANVNCTLESEGTVNVPTTGTISGEITVNGTVNVPTSGEISNLIINGEGIIEVPTTVTIKPETFDTTTETIEIYKHVACVCEPIPDEDPEDPEDPWTPDPGVPDQNVPDPGGAV